MKRLTTGIAISLIIVFGMLAADAAHAKDKETLYEVTITNITRGQIISPPIVISHSKDFQLFNLGSHVPPGLAELAEDGMTGPLAAVLDTLDSVYNHNDQSTTGGPIHPGASVTVEITTEKGFRQLSAAGMLVSSNDAFFAIRGVDAASKGDLTMDARAYDAGTEINSEQCAYIPGPPWGNGGVHDPADAEGYVYIHSGIHGIGDLDPAEFDWRNPVATIMVQKVK